MAFGYGVGAILIVKYDACVGVDAQMIKNNIIASQVQVFLDCMGLKGRGT